MYQIRNEFGKKFAAAFFQSLFSKFYSSIVNEFLISEKKEMKQWFFVLTFR